MSFGALFRSGFRVRSRLRARIDEGGIERCSQVVQLSVVGDSCDEEFIAKALRMGSTSKKNEQSAHFRFGVDDYLPSQNEGSSQRAVKLRAVAVHAGIEGVEHLNLEDRTFRQSA